MYMRTVGNQWGLSTYFSVFLSRGLEMILQGILWEDPNSCLEPVDFSGAWQGPFTGQNGGEH